MIADKAEEAAALDRFFDLSIDPLALVSAQDGTWRKVSRSFERTFGWSEPELVGEPAADLVHPDERSRFVAALADLRPDALPRDLEHRMRDKAGGWRRVAWRMALAGDGLACCFGREAAVDASAPGRPPDASDRLQSLVAELRHRTGNLIAVVQAIAGETSRSSRSLDDFRETFSGRLASIARVHDLMSRLDEGERVSFDELIGSELNASGLLGGGIDDGKVILDGPAGVRLRSSALQLLALAIHELAAEAVRHGALSRPDGRLSVRWELVPPKGDQRATLHVEWIETGTATAPRRGFDRELIEEALPFQLGAETRYEARADGLRCAISFPVSAQAP